MEAYLKKRKQAMEISLGEEIRWLEVLSSSAARTGGGRCFLGVPRLQEREERDEGCSFGRSRNKEENKSQAARVGVSHELKKPTARVCFFSKNRALD